MQAQSYGSPTFCAASAMAHAKGLSKLAAAAFLPLMLITLRFLFGQAEGASVLPAGEVDALLQFKAHLDVLSQEMLSSWDANSTHGVCESWVGITCHLNNIQAINLTGFELSGSLVPHLGNLSSISLLDLSSNFFEGSIPLQLSGCTSLKQLNLSNNSLTGFIPSSLGAVSSLQLLSLSVNHLMGHIPETLFSNSTSLVQLILSYNALTGSISSHIGAMMSLQWFVLISNNLTGAIPPSLGNCTSLIYLHLFENQLDGPIPPQLGLLLRLKNLALSGNSLTGGIPDSLGNCTSLTALAIANNWLVGPIPASLGALTNLRGLHLHHNKLGGAIPPSLGNCTALIFIQLGNNQLTGPLPKELGLLVHLYWLNIYGNKLTGVIPQSIGNCTALNYLTLAENGITGSIPTELMMLGLLEGIDLSFNHLSEDFKMLSVSNLSSIISLDFTSNQLTGSIPRELGQSPQLQYLRLAGNSFSNEIPWDYLANCTSLYYLDLSYNQLSGSISGILGRLRGLQYLYLQSNYLGGVIPDVDFSDHLRFHEVDLSFNQLNGSVPSSLAHALSTLTGYLDLSHNQFWGSLPSWLGEMVQMTGLALSHNRFVGTIPESLGDCVGLTTLDLSHNLLDGDLPGGLDSLIYLQKLDLSSNHLSGVLPSFLERLQHLRFLNVSFNNFTGPIPQLGIFKQLNASSFEGNPGLCGPIAKRICIIPSSPKKHARFSRKLIVVAAVVLPTLAVVSSAVLAKYWYRCKYCRQCFEGENEELECSLAIATKYTADALTKATQGYCEQNLLGEGALSRVYKGVMPDGKAVAVKILKEVCFREALLKEVQILSKLRHRNLVHILGCIFNLDMNALILEYMPNGSLHQYLHRFHEQMDWRMLIHIAVGVANALSYLHHEYGVPIIHGDVKPENILLDADLEAHLADFGLAKLVKEGGVSVSSNFKGSIGYMAPEYAYGVRVTTKVDVYSFGVVVLEMLTGRKPTQLPESMTLHDWVTSKLRDGSASVGENVLHASLVNTGWEASSASLSNSSNALAVQLLKMGVACTQDQPLDRPTMYQILAFLGELRTTYPIDEHINA